MKAPWLTEAGQEAPSTARSRRRRSATSPRSRRGSAPSTPVRILWGADDEWIPPATGERLAGLIPGASFALIPGAGHLVHHDAPVPLASELRAWLAR